jgi:hypothetical protein
VAGQGLQYTPDPKYHAACQQFETDPGKARLVAAKAVAPTPDDVKDWPATWASATLLAARSAFDGLSFDHAGAGKPADWV